MSTVHAIRSWPLMGRVWMPWLSAGSEQVPLTKLNAMGVKVYAAAAPTVKENLELLSENKLQELSVYNACRAHQGGCGH